MKEKRKAYEEKLDAQFEEWNAQIALLKAKADGRFHKVKGKTKRRKNDEKTVDDYFYCVSPDSSRLGACRT
ncbi:MAG: hypothetical protein KKF12_02415 [Proteobacteria bacterium]|nr:hypothetical protein [Pseudomonadota bacterium]MBU4129655.1 hypothetical protein [Pseudomonadota bacterium]